MTKIDEVRIILRNIEAMGKPYPNFLMRERRNPYAAPEPRKRLPLGKLYLAVVGGGASVAFLSAAVALLIAKVT